MASSTYGRKLNPYRRLRDPLGVKGVRQSVVVTNNPSTIDQNQQLLVRFPNLGAHDVIVPGTARLAFTVSLTSTDANRTIVQNLGRAIVKKMTIKISGNEVLSIDDSDVFHCYQDLWKTAQERSNSQYQGIDLSDDQNVTRICVGAENKDETETKDAAIAAAFGNRYHVPLDFELLESHMPFYQSALGDRLEYELTFNDYSRVVVATGDAAASYSIDNIALEFDMVTQPDLARQIRNQTPLWGQISSHVLIGWTMAETEGLSRTSSLTRTPTWDWSYWEPYKRKALTTWPFSYLIKVNIPLHHDEESSVQSEL